MSLNPTQPIALVTHATRFAGRPAVRALQAARFDVIAHDVEFSDAAAAAAFERAFPGVETVCGDDPGPLVDQVAKHGRGLAALISNDAHPVTCAALADASVTALRETLEQLVVWPFRLIQAALPELMRAARARVVWITSCRTALPQAGGAVPDAGRAAANALIAALAIELAAERIPINAIAPNFLYSETYYPRAHYVDNPVGRDFVAAQVPAGRLGEPDEIGELIRYLATMEGDFLTGSVIPFAGGWPAAPPRPF